MVKAAQGGVRGRRRGALPPHWPHTHRAAYLIVRDAAAAEDIAQEAFLSALSALDRFDRRRPFAPWLHRIAVNRAIDWSRARAVRHEVRRPSARCSTPRGRAGGRGGLERGGEVEAAIGRLSAEQRAVVVLRYLLEYTPGEIGRMLDLPRGTVNSRLRRGARPALGAGRGRGHEGGAPARGAARRSPSPMRPGREERGLGLVRAASRPSRRRSGPRRRPASAARRCRWRWRWACSPF